MVDEYKIGDEWHLNPLSRFTELVKLYQDVIIHMFFGHIHRETFKFITDKEKSMFSSINHLSFIYFHFIL